MKAEQFKEIAEQIAAEKGLALVSLNTDYQFRQLPQFHASLKVNEEILVNLFYGTPGNNKRHRAWFIVSPGIPKLNKHNTFNSYSYIGKQDATMFFPVDTVSAATVGLACEQAIGLAQKMINEARQREIDRRFRMEALLAEGEKFIEATRGCFTQTPERYDGTHSTSRLYLKNSLAEGYRSGGTFEIKEGSIKVELNLDTDRAIKLANFLKDL